jgi:hypothetical protein
VVATGWGAQVVTTPVIDHIVPVTVFHRQATAPMKLMLWAGAAFAPARLVVVATVMLATAL